MITCTCGKTIEKVPTWMQSIQVEFVCNNCPNRQTKNIALAALELETPSVAKLEESATEPAKAEETEEAKA